MPLDQLKQVTGYIRGGCSPIGMKHLFQTVIDQSALQREQIYISGGQRGMQIIIAVKEKQERKIKFNAFRSAQTSDRIY